MATLRRKKIRPPVFSRLTLAWSAFFLVVAGLGAFLAFFKNEGPQLALAIDGEIETLAQPATTVAPAERLAAAMPAEGVRLSAPPVLRDRVERGAEPYAIDVDDALGETDSFVQGQGGEQEEAEDDFVITIEGAIAKSGTSSPTLAGLSPQEPSARPVRMASIDPDLTKASGFGQVPRIGANGKKSAKIYARPYRPDGAAPVGLIVGGLGLNQKLTERAIEELPGEVTLAFAPYAKNLDYWTKRAREKGHEVVLELPMEHRSGDQSALGPAALLTGRTTIENLQRLDWLLTRTKGYVGVTNYLGSKFSTDKSAISPILSKIHSSGLAYFDDTGALGRFVKHAEARDATVVNRIVEPGLDDIKKTSSDLAALERIANNEGAALGKTYVHGSTIDEIVAWANGLRSRDLALAPASAIIAIRRDAS